MKTETSEEGLEMKTESSALCSVLSIVNWQNLQQQTKKGRANDKNQLKCFLAT